VSGGRFCKRHKSHFCPCACPWLYTTREREDYERGRWHGDESSNCHAVVTNRRLGQPRRETDQMRLA
jgi:hypothetical protein